MLRRTWEYLLPGEAEQDEGFRREIQKLGRQGLRVVVGVEIAVPILLMAAHFLVLGHRDEWAGHAWRFGTVTGVGLLTAIPAWMKQRSGFPYRLFGCLSGWLVAAVLITFSLLWDGLHGGGDHYVPGHVTVVLLVGVAALPLKPMHTLSLGLSMGLFYAILGPLAASHQLTAPVDPDGSQRLFIAVVTLVCAGLSALLYVQRFSTYRAHQEALRASETVSRAQLRSLLSENAASLGRLAAALSHELNSPIGALKSGVDTLLALTSRQATSGPEEQKRLVPLVADLRRSVLDSGQRLQQIVARLQRFTNLDKANVQQTDINALVGDVVALMEPEIKDGVKVELDLGQLPPLMCRPQQLSAVFSSLIHNAVDAVTNGSGRVVIRTEGTSSEVEVRIHDNGRGLRTEELKAIFDPGFKISGGRVSTGNWSLFSARQIIREHGGEIHIQSAEGKGTTVSVTLPRLRESELD